MLFFIEELDNINRPLLITKQAGSEETQADIFKESKFILLSSDFKIIKLVTSFSKKFKFDNKNIELVR